VSDASQSVPGANGQVLGEDAELSARRERLIERFALMQTELGGLFYEMAIRDHLELDVLAAKAAALQLIETELAEIERLLDSR
jgi:hypothetical protein